MQDNYELAVTLYTGPYPPSPSLFERLKSFVADLNSAQPKMFGLEPIPTSTAGPNQDKNYGQSIGWDTKTVREYQNYKIMKDLYYKR